MKTAAPTKYFVYARKSTDTEDRQVRSIPDQLAEMRELAGRLNLDIADIFTESQTATVLQEIRQKAAQIERLVLALTDGTLSNEEFRAAKNRVVSEKRDLEEKAVGLEKNRLGWLEPAIAFISASQEATEWKSSPDPVKERDFFTKVGSNRRITNKQLVWEPRGAWKTLVPVGRFAHNTSGASCDAPPFSGEPFQHGSKLGD